MYIKMRYYFYAANTRKHENKIFITKIIQCDLNYLFVTIIITEFIKIYIMRNSSVLLGALNNSTTALRVTD